MIFGGNGEGSPALTFAIVAFFALFSAAKLRTFVAKPAFFVVR
jgi:hypothetical protein